jgi:hypothetical protein
MPSKPSQREEARNVIQRLYERGEEAVGVFVEEFIGNKRVREELGKTIGRAADAKKRVDKNMAAVLSAFNLPSRADLHRLQTKIEALQGSMVNLSMKLDRLLAAQQEHSHRANAEHHPAPPRRSAHKKTGHSAG